jgi:hypothetical protein
MHGMNIKIIILYMSAYVIMVTTMHYRQQECLNTNTMYIFTDFGIKSFNVVVFIMSYEKCKLFNRSLCLKTHQTRNPLQVFRYSFAY